jgi:2,4-dienoyl-CoA reductase-like NADH-dependent reductase (Old Yellow Enzyme family)
MMIKTADDLAAEAAARDRARAVAEARAYLADTDWMVIRAAETGTPVPDDVTAARAAARATISNSAP